MRTKISEIKQITVGSVAGQTFTIMGWVRTVRMQKKFSFIEVNDGSSLKNLQVIAAESLDNWTNLQSELTTGCSVRICGTLEQSPGKNQDLELHATLVEIIGKCDPETYPLQKKRHSFEFLRTIAHLRPRTNTIGAVARVRNALSFATHKFFQERKFLYVHTPIITASDCEGGGEMFRVSTLDLDKVIKDKKADFSQDFFQKPAYLTVSGQLNGEIYACALSDIYTFGPTFRAENSHTSRHLAEFWMIEPEIAFADLNDDIELAEKYLKYVVKYVLDNCADDIEFFDKFIRNGLAKDLAQLVNTPFQRLSYTEAVNLLKKADKSFEYPVEWGSDLQSEHERYLAEELFGKPVILTDYPKDIKAFYMRLNDDEKTVAAMDILVPKIGEIIGGSQREERIPQLEAQLAKFNLNPQDYWWYLELRKYGSVPHAGFGAGFERLVQLATGMENIRDVIPFPRYPGSAEF